MKPFLCQSNLMEIVRWFTKMRQNLATCSFWDITGFKIVVSLEEKILLLHAFSVISFFIYTLLDFYFQNIHLLDDEISCDNCYVIARLQYTIA